MTSPSGTVSGSSTPASLRPGQVFVWTLFDFANTPFSTIIVVVGYSLYFKEIVVGEARKGDFLWGVAVSISMLLTAVLSPVLGAASDYSGKRKRFLLGFTVASIVCTVLLGFVDPGMVLVGMILFVIANVGFEGGIVFYNAFLPDIAPPEQYGRVSGYGFAMGYVGALISILIAIPLYHGGFAPANIPNVKLSFIVAASMFLAFSLPLFLFLREGRAGTKSGGSYVRAGFNRVRDTLRHLRQYSQVSRFLVAFFVYNDGILTVISFASLFAKESLQFTLEEVLLLFGIVQVSAVAGSLLFGSLTDRIGARRTITITLICWIIVTLASFFVTSKEVFYGIGLLAGTCLGGSQSASRTLMTLLTPKSKEAEFFGFFDGFCGKASAVLGTFMFGLLSWVTGSQRLAILVIALFFVVGLMLLHRVDEPRRKQILPSTGTYHG